MGTTPKRSPRPLVAVVLAAGKGKRLRSDTPKVLHPVCGRPVLWHTLQVVRAAKPSRIVVVVGHGADDVREAVRSWDLVPEPIFVEQAEQLGTGHAVQLAEDAVGKAADVLVANGDFDPITPADLRKLLASHRRTGAAVTLGSTILDRPGGYGRVVRDGRRVTDVIEGRDAPPDVRKIHEVATNWIAFRRDLLYATLPLLDRENRQREYYLNRAISILLDKGERVDAVVCDTGGVIGANTRAGLAGLETLIRRRTNESHMAAGVRADRPGRHVHRRRRADRQRHRRLPEHVPRDGRPDRHGMLDRALRRDRPLADRRRLGRVVLGPRGSPGRQGLRGRARSPACGPEPSWRTAPWWGTSSRSRAPGSARARRPSTSRTWATPSSGAGVNIGAGTVFVNYDGYEKHLTVVGDGARIGSDTMLVAPVQVGKGAVTGAGSVITKDVPAGRSRSNAPSSRS